ncbi:MAG: hypothetical protein AAGC77_06155 [Pseudomonadota bacterium]
MRKLLLFIGFVLAVGAAGNLGLFGYSAWVIHQGGWADPWVSMGDMVAEHMPFLNGLVSWAFAYLPANLMEWASGLPALVYFGGRAVLAWVLASISLGVGKRL